MAHMGDDLIFSSNVHTLMLKRFHDIYENSLLKLYFTLIIMLQQPTMSATRT